MSQILQELVETKTDLSPLFLTASEPRKRLHMALLNTVKIPWAAWYEDKIDDSKGKQITFPNGWEVKTVQPPKDSQISNQGISKAFDSPTGSPLVAELITKKTKKVCIAVDDLTRPACLEPVLKVLLRILHESGIRDDQIEIIFAIGLHKPLSAEEIIKKLGSDLASTVKITSHNAERDLVDIDLENGKSVPINRAFVESDIKVVVGTVMPHFYAGYSGGAKIVLPGLAGVSAVANTHKSVLMGLSGKLRQVEGNRFRDRVETIAKTVGVDFSIQLTVNSKREITGVFTGDIVSSHRAAVAFGERAYVSEFPENLDIVVVNAFPKDTELLQCENAFVAYRSAKNLLRPEGTVVLITACTEGLGEHGLFGPGKMLYRQPRPYGFLEGRHLIVFAPGASQDDFKVMFSPEYTFHRVWEEVLGELKKRHCDQATRVAIFPCGPLQLANQI